MVEEHKESRETLDFIGDWEGGSIPFSKKDGWGRFGFLAVLGDMILYSLLEGNILEIGVGESSIYLTQLARKHHRKSYHCDISEGKIVNPLTVKGYLNEDHILIYEKQPIPDYSKAQSVLYVGSSDNFFKDIKTPNISLAFIDGDHIYEQVKKDFDNLLPRMLDDGYIFLHDTYPPDDFHLQEARCGTVYKLRQELEKREDIDVFTFTKLIMVGVGLTMIRKKPKNLPFYKE